MVGYSHVVWNPKDSEFSDKEISNGFGLKIGIAILLNTGK